MLEATYRNCGWTKETEKQIKTCWWSDDVKNCARERCNLLKEWKEEAENEKKYPEAKRKFREAVYRAKYEAEGNRVADIIENDLKYEVFKILKPIKIEPIIVKANEDIGEQYIPSKHLPIQIHQ